MNPKIMGYVLQQAGVPCANLIAQMLGKGKPTSDTPHLPTAAEYHEFGGLVLPTPTMWDTEAMPYAYINRSGSTLTLYVSGFPIKHYDNGILKKGFTFQPPYAKAKYTRDSGWGEFEITESGAAYNISGYPSSVLWANADILYEDGRIAVKCAGTKPFYEGQPDTPTAFLYDNGKLVFQNDSVPTGTYIGAYIGWDTANYTSNGKVPWMAVDTDSITSFSIGSDVVINHTAYWFYGCKNITSTSPLKNLTNLTEIGDYMFYQVPLLNFNVPNGVTRIGKYAFYDCCSDDTQDYAPSGASLVLPDTVTTIGDNAFDYTNYLGSVTLSENLTEIGSNAFAHIYALSKITIPSAVKRIGKNVFNQTHDNFGNQAVGLDVTFENPNGWWVSEDPEATSGTLIENPNEDGMISRYYTRDVYGNYTTHEPVYGEYYWNRTDDDINE